MPIYPDLNETNGSHYYWYHDDHLKNPNIMLTSAAITQINHILHSEQWACEQLQTHAGRTASIRIPPLLSLDFCIDATGRLQHTDGSAVIDTTITLPPLILPGLLAREPAAFHLIAVTGNEPFAHDLINIGKQINFSVIIAHNLSKTIGDIPAQRITQAGEDFVHWQADSMNRLMHTLAEYWTEENIYLTKSAAVSRFSQQIEKLQFGTAQLEQRLNKLIHQSDLTGK